MSIPGAAQPITRLLILATLLFGGMLAQAHGEIIHVIPYLGTSEYQKLRALALTMGHKIEFTNFSDISGFRPGSKLLVLHANPNTNDIVQLHRASQRGIRFVYIIKSQIFLRDAKPDKYSDAFAEKFSAVPVCPNGLNGEEYAAGKGIRGEPFSNLFAGLYVGGVNYNWGVMCYLVETKKDTNRARGTMPIGGKNRIMSIEDSNYYIVVVPTFLAQDVYFDAFNHSEVLEKLIGWLLQK